MINDEKIKEGVKLLLEGIGEDKDREGLLETPDRIARMYHEICGGYEMDPEEILKKRFKAENSEMVLEKDIVFYSSCEHHMLPFFGKVHIAYIPNGEVVGLSKLARLVEVYARRLQIQERLTEQVAEAIQEVTKAEGVGVVFKCRHLCMMMRGVEKQNSEMTTSAVLGTFRSDERVRQEFLSLIS